MNSENILENFVRKSFSRCENLRFLRDDRTFMYVFRSLLFIVILLCGVMISPAARGQDYKQLQKEIQQKQKKTRSKIDQINAQINDYQQRFNKTNQKYEQIYKRYQHLNRLLALRKKKIASLEEKRKQINQEITITRTKIDEQQTKLKNLIANYKKTLRYVYENGRTSELALILSSASLHQMMVRNYYLKKFEKYRKKQVADIKKTKASLKKNQQRLHVAAQQNEKLLDKIKKEKETLAKKTREQQANVRLLRKNKQQIKKKLAEVKQDKEDLNNTLSNLIAREKRIRKAKKRRKKKGVASNKSKSKANSSPTASTASERTGYVGRVGFLSDKQLQKIQASFAKDKGDLPWPVASSTISEHFGRHRDPVSGTITPNLGIEIVTQPDAPVHVVHKGYVFAVRPITGYGDVVFVSHGKYKTAYGNLSRVTVRKNTILKKGQVVGYSGDKNSARGASVFFMLRDGNKNVNPENWLKNK